MLSEIRRRDELPALERAVSDTLDEYLIRMHGITTSWAHPVEFIKWLEKRGYKIELEIIAEDENAKSE